MENKHSDTPRNSRRNFLKFGFALGAGAIAGAGILNALTSSEAKAETITLLTPKGELVQVDSTLLKPIDKAQILSENQKKGREGMAGKKWVMVIDLSKCRNARMCMAACNDAHHYKRHTHSCISALG